MSTCKIKLRNMLCQRYFLACSSKLDVYRYSFFPNQRGCGSSVPIQERLKRAEAAGKVFGILEVIFSFVVTILRWNTLLVFEL